MQSIRLTFRRGGEKPEGTPGRRSNLYKKIMHSMQMREEKKKQKNNQNYNSEELEMKSLTLSKQQNERGVKVSSSSLRRSSFNSPLFMVENVDKVT